jgi:Dolichyl-phosphate-mannose-protein mannosyltransferase
MGRIRASAERLPPWAALVGIIGLSTLVRAAAGAFVPTPWIMGDEVVYSQLGRNLYEHGHLWLLGRPVPFYSLVYPAFVGLPFMLFGTHAGYAVAKVAQSLAMSLAAVPVYYWARELASTRWALVAAALTVCVPGLAYSGLLMSEAAFYPLAVFAVWATARAVATGTMRAQAFAVGALGVALLTRLQAVALVAAYITAVLLVGRPIRRFVSSLGALAVLAAAWGVWRLHAGGPASQLFGAYRAAAETSYDPGDVARFVAYHLADAALVGGVLPFGAAALLIASAWRTDRDPALRAYAAVAAALTGWLVLEVGAFASVHVGRLAERDVLVLAPVAFVGLAAWSSRGAPRPRGALVTICAGVLALVVFVPFGRFAQADALPDAFMLAPLIELRGLRRSVNLDLFAVDVVVVLLALLAFVPRRRAWVVAATTALVLLSTSIFAGHAVARESGKLRDTLVADDASWIDDATDANVAYVYDGDPYWNAVYENVFWNHRLHAVYDLAANDVPGPLPQSPIGPRRDGLLVDRDGRSVSAPLLVGEYALTFFGKPLAYAPSSRLTLWRVGPRPRLGSWLAGMDVYTYTGGDGEFSASGDVASHAQLTIYRCNGGQVKVQLVATAARLAQLKLDGRVVANLSFVPLYGQVRIVRLPNDRPARTCDLEISSPNGLLHVLRLELHRA